MKEDIHIFESCISELFPYKNSDIGELITKIALYFIGTPYKEYTLDSEPETLIINLRQFDCQTFIENVLAIASTLKEESPTFEYYCNYLQNIRYRQGRGNEYNNRLAYFSDWITDNEEKGYVKDITKESGGTLYRFNLNYWSSHPEIYKQLYDREKMIHMQQKEKELSNRNIYSKIDKTIPVDGIIHNGDIIAFTTNKPGLEITHVALAYYDNTRLTFIHATSIDSRTVVISPLSLHDYIHKNSFITGLMIIRPK